MPAVHITELGRETLPSVAVLLGLAYRDNPLTIALLGNDAELRMRVGEQIHAIRIAAMERRPLGVKSGDRVVGVCGFEPPGGVTLSPEQQRQMLTILSRAGPDVVGRAQGMLSEFGKHVPDQRHWKLGPVAVVPDLQSQGVGSRMVEQFCARTDAVGDLVHLDTDQVKNVRLYEKFGFHVVHEAPVLGVPMWFMTRRAARQGE